MARSLNGLAATYTRLGVPAAALEYARQARAVMRERQMDRGPGTEAVEFTSELLAGNAQRALGQSPVELALHFLRPGVEQPITWDDAARRRAIQLLNERIAAATSKHFADKLTRLTKH